MDFPSAPRKRSRIDQTATGPTEPLSTAILVRRSVRNTLLLRLPIPVYAYCCWGLRKVKKYMDSGTPRLSSDLRHLHISDKFDCWESQGYVRPEILKASQLK
jgi:hypothetical protein